MNYSGELQILADRASRGDLGALRKLRQELQHCMGPILRRALRQEDDASGLFERIQKTALRLVGRNNLGDAELVVGEVARSICEDLFRPAYRPAGLELARETVRNW